MTDETPPTPPTPSPPVTAPTVTLEPGYPVKTFDHHVAGVAPLVAGGTVVPASLVREIEKVARKLGIRVVELLADDAAKPVAKFFRRVVSDIEEI